MFPSLFANILKCSDLTFAEHMKPEKIPPITVIKDINSADQSRDFTTFDEYDIFVYMIKLTGNIIIESSVDMVVIVTERAKSALNIEHHQFE
mmetsp:Transcript_40263/g.45816  ORF Transcript_40263/g.45816 Transcript_40263/m.45816 type:complete len:92 (-) Transcript_40263:332-607(-)